MQDRTIDNALAASRVQLMCENRDGLEHVAALLRLRRASLPPVTRGPRQAFQRREIAALLRDGPKPRVLSREAGPI